jgi:hypothetical protein
MNVDVSLKNSGTKLRLLLTSVALLAAGQVALPIDHLHAAPILDSTPTAAAAYSLRNLRTAYVGPAIQVRRSSDNATQDIGLTGAGVLDVAALESFVGAGNSGFVVRWYDQSGSGKDIIQTATSLNQPQIVASGSVLRASNGEPAVRFDGVSDRMRITAGGSGVDLQMADAFVIAEFIAPPATNDQSQVFSLTVGSTDFLRTSAGAFGDSTDGPLHALFYRDQNTAMNVTELTDVPVANDVLFLSAISLDALQAAGNDTLNYHLNGGEIFDLDGLNILDVGGEAGNVVLGAAAHGAMDPAGTFFNGYIQEFILFNSDSNNLSSSAFDAVTQDLLSTFQSAMVPEPSTLLLAACGSLSYLVSRRRRRRV